MKLLIKQTIVSFFFMVGAITYTPTYAGGIPTVDVANVLQTSVTAFESIEQTVALAEQIENQIRAYQQEVEGFNLQQQIRNSTVGSRGLGRLIDGAQQAQDRRYAPTNWRSALNTIQAGGIPGSNQSYKVALEEIQNQSATASELGLSTNGNIGLNARNYNRLRAIDITSGAIADSSYSATEERTRLIEALISQIDLAEDQKAALDLSNVLIAQLLTLTNEQTALQATAIHVSRSTNKSISQATEIDARFNR